MVDDILFELKADDFACGFKSGQRSTFFIQLLVNERLDHVEHRNEIFAPDCGLS